MSTPSTSAALPDTYTVPEVARRLHLSVAFVYRAIAAGTFPIPVMRFGRRVIVARHAFERYLEYSSEHEHEA